MDFFFYAVPLLMMAIAAAAAVGILRRARRMRAAWASGLTARARCLRTYATTRGGNNRTTTQHHVYEFVARDGRPVRFEEADGPAMTVEGDIVTVHYTAEHPEHATACPPRSGLLSGQVLGVLIVLGVVVAFCVFFMSAFGGAPDGFGGAVP
ncbi:DUF3592 domain-containing protein [Streptomyces sp. KLOTTS4A1]|uniref:DUF3592 domain-containing protein n=1 Tax=Streptomyces sp. KLOTTS4A1 TaxID=3390996 RepID=UPI0039F5E4E7